MPKGVYPRRSVLERFESMYIPEPNTGCWLWLAGISKDDGYGKFKADYHSFAAHRMSYLLYKGPIINDLYVLHTCDLPCCVNPDHLWLGTPDDNSKDMVRKGRQAKHEKNAKAKLTKLDVIEIRRNSISKHKDIALRYGVTRAMISHIKRGAAWR